MQGLKWSRMSVDEARQGMKDSILNVIRTVPADFSTLFLDLEHSRHRPSQYDLPVDGESHSELALFAAEFIRAAHLEEPHTAGIITSYLGNPTVNGIKPSRLTPALQWLSEIAPEIQVIEGVLNDDAEWTGGRIFGKPGVVPVIQEGASYSYVAVDPGDGEAIEQVCLALFNLKAKVGKIIVLGNKEHPYGEEGLAWPGKVPVYVGLSDKEFSHMRAYYAELGILPPAEYLPGDDEDRRRAWV